MIQKIRYQWKLKLVCEGICCMHTDKELIDKLIEWILKKLQWVCMCMRERALCVCMREREGERRTILNSLYDRELYCMNLVWVSATCMRLGSSFTPTSFRIQGLCCPWGRAQVVKGWGGFVGGSRVKPNEDKNLPLKKNMDSPRKDINNRHGHLNTSLKKEKKNQ